jgi:hypothetical protein
MNYATVVLSVALVFTSTATHAEDVSSSANSYLPGCEAALRGEANLAAGRCIGVMEGLAVLGPLNVFCAPDTTSTSQWMRVVLKFIKDRPERMHQDFRVLAVEALKEAWPCSGR